MPPEPIPLSLADEILKEAGSQLVALVVFFAFPALQYVLLRRFARNEAVPELWYLPRFGFRLVIRNIPGKKILSDIKVLVRLRKIVPASAGASATTFIDETLIQREDMFVFPGNDQIMLCFRLEVVPGATPALIYTDKLGMEIRKYPMADFDKLIVDYAANVKNLFNFDIKISKRVEITSTELQAMVQEIIRLPEHERTFEIGRIRAVG